MITYRRLEHSDYEDILDISKYIWDGTDYLPQVFHSWVDDKGYFLGAVDSSKNKVIGVGKYSILYDGSGWLEGLRVHKDYRDMKLGREISERLLFIAKDELKSKRINKIAFSTHISSTRSITLMKKLGFELEQEYVMTFKSYDKADGLLQDSFVMEEWKLGVDDFLNLPCFKLRNNTMPLVFVFQKPTEELYNYLKNKKAFVSINGCKGIFLQKGEPHFIAADDSFESINTFMDYYLVNLKDKGIPEPLTSVLPGDTKLIEKLRKNGFESCSNWESDYLYYVYK